MRNKNRDWRAWPALRSCEPADEDIAPILAFFGACKYAVNAFEDLPQINVKTDDTGEHFFVTAPNPHGKEDSILMTITRAPGGFEPRMKSTFAPREIAKRSGNGDDAEFYGIDDVFGKSFVAFSDS